MPLTEVDQDVMIRAHVVVAAELLMSEKAVPDLQTELLLQEEEVELNFPVVIKVEVLVEDLRVQMDLEGIVQQVMQPVELKLEEE